MERPESLVAQPQPVAVELPVAALPERIQLLPQTVKLDQPEASIMLVVAEVVAVAHGQLQAVQRPLLPAAREAQAEFLVGVAEEAVLELPPLAVQRIPVTEETVLVENVLSRNSDKRKGPFGPIPTY